MSEKTFTQDEVNALVGKARIEARESKAKEFEGWLSPDDLAAKTSELNDKVASLTSALSSANEELNNNKTLIAEKDNTIKAHELRSEKTRIAHEMGLPYDAVNFLQGDDAAAIKASAESLKHLVEVNPSLPLVNHEPIGKDSKTEALKEIVSNLRKD